MEDELTTNLRLFSPAKKLCGMDFLQMFEIAINRNISVELFSRMIRNYKMENYVSIHYWSYGETSISLDLSSDKYFVKRSECNNIDGCEIGELFDLDYEGCGGSAVVSGRMYFDDYI